MNYMCSCGRMLDIPSDTCSTCWEEYSQTIYEESLYREQMPSMASPETVYQRLLGDALEGQHDKRINIASGEDVCLYA